MDRYNMNEKIASVQAKGLRGQYFVSFRESLPSMI